MQDNNSKAFELKKEPKKQYKAIWINRQTLQIINQILGQGITANRERDRSHY